MISNNRIFATEDNNVNNMGEIIENGLKNPVVRYFCVQGKGKNLDEIKKIRSEFCRFVGYCILFRSSQDIEKYMLLQDKEQQKYFLKKRIAKILGIPEEQIVARRDEIIQYAYQKFKKHGYVFHAANSSSVKMKMITGLKDNDINVEQQKELLHIESLYRKYHPNSLYSPLGHGATDILENKTGWFFDGFPIHSMGYANSPQWFSYLCGKSYVYFDSIPEERREGYANRDYETALEAIIWLIKNERMSLEDAKEIIGFFKKCWNKYKDTTPCLMFIPVDEVGVNDEIAIEQYLSDEGMELLFDDITLGKVNPGKNYCCKKVVLPQKLSYVDLSPILPRFKIERHNIEKQVHTNKSSQQINLDDDGNR